MIEVSCFFILQLTIKSIFEFFEFFEIMDLLIEFDFVEKLKITC